MTSRATTPLAAVALAALTLAACSKDTSGDKNAVVFGEFVSSEDSLPRIRYTESGLVSVNDRCPVRKTRLNVKMPPVYVNGEPVGFC